MVKKPGRAGEGAVGELGKKCVKTLARKEESLKELYWQVKYQLKGKSNGGI